MTKEQIVIVGVVVFGAFFALFNQIVMSPAIPVIMTDFGIDATTANGSCRSIRLSAESWCLSRAF